MKKILYFFFIGGTQFLIDALLFALLVKFGIVIAIANLLSRALAACCGYYLNGKFTFKAKMTVNVFLKFILYWLFMTTLSTVMLLIIDHYILASSSDNLLALSKIAVELLLFLLSFFIAKIWVYK